MSSRTVDRDTMPALAGDSEPVAAPSGGGDDYDKAPRWIYVLLAGGLFLVVAPFMWMLRLVVQARARGARRAADLVAGDGHARELRPAVHPARLPDVLHELRRSSRSP